METPNERKPLLNINDPSDANLEEPSTSFSIKHVFSKMIKTLKENKSIIFWCIGCVISSVLQGVYIKLAGNALANFPYFLFWFTCIPFVILFFAYYYGCLLFTKQVTKEMRSVPQYKMAIIGVLTAINGIFILFASPNVPGVMQALLGPTIVTIPMAMILSFIMLKRRYNFYQVIAVVIILGGLAIAIYPSISQSLHSSGNIKSQVGSIFWNCMFLLGSIPSALSTVYEEKAFEEQPIHISYMLAYSTLWQMISIFASFPVDAIPHFGTASSFKGIFTDQLTAFKCLAGHEIEKSLCPTCDCKHAGFYVFMFVLFYVLSSFFVLGVVKYGNAAFSFIVATISTPLQEFAFALPFLMGSQVETISKYNYASLAVLVVGVIIYRIFDRKVNSAESTEEVIHEDGSINGSHQEEDHDSLNVVRSTMMRSYATVQIRPFVARTTIDKEKEKYKIGDTDAYYFTYP